MNRFGDGDNGNLMLPSLQQTSCEESVADRVEISENKEQTKVSFKILCKNMLVYKNEVNI